MNNLNEQISKYLEYCQYQKRLDEKTLKAYRIDLRQFTEQIPPTDIRLCHLSGKDLCEAVCLLECTL